MHGARRRLGARANTVKRRLIRMSGKREVNGCDAGGTVQFMQKTV
jgi:hypothetical protein